MASDLIEAIRPFWMPGLVSIPKITLEGFAPWISREGYQIYDQIEVEKAKLAFADPDELAAALAYDLNRFAAAAFETVNSAIRSTELPKSTAWLCIKGYYGAYYAAHALVRSLGHTYSRLDSPQVGSVNRIADLYGSGNGIQLSSATYSGAIDAATNSITITRIPDTQGGASHSGFWRFFLVQLRDLSSLILTGPGLSTQKQRAAMKLNELGVALCSNGQNGGTWLSAIRNEINYRHQHGCWYPYGYRRQFADQLYTVMLKWKQDPYSLDLSANRDRDLIYFLTVCVFLISLSRELAQSIVERRLVRPVFIERGCLQLLSLSS